MPAIMAVMMLCMAPQVIDGDGIRCRGPRGYVGEVRLLGIDAPDYRSSRPCRQHFGDHRCDDRGARAAKEALRQGLQLGPVQLVPVTHDRYGRLIARAIAGGEDLGCRQLRLGVARYIPKYDNGRRLGRACPAATRNMQ